MQSEDPGWVPGDAAPPPELAEPPPPAIVVVTAPSSPDGSPEPPKSPLPPPLLGNFDVRTLSDVTSGRTPVRTPSAASPSATAHSLSMPAFDARLATADLPLPGPDRFCARRALWCQPGPNPPQPAEVHPSRRRLEDLLSAPGAVENDATWAAGLDRVWHSLVNGAKLRHRLPLALVLKILQAGWIREGTWPRGAAAPSSDDEDHPQEQTPLPPESTPD